ncbi:MAG: Endoribonuclease YbeY [Candidatus Anoxychlamydiales bacterium]|nr:Endoribonuclease YbeY [Candidatus Anoxychlamydiales bacterium]NGX53175.1 Endoribonuclease YbeY [Candidatus Anoxychlamydiales bacterium]
MKVTIVNEQTSLEVSEKLVEKQIKAILKEEKIKTDEVILHFVDEKKIKKLHLKLFNDPEETDCITQPIDRPGNKTAGFHILGEAFICTDLAIKNAQEFKTTPYHELALYIIHTILHLIGYDDINKEEVKVMRKKENYYLNLLKEKNIFKK